MINKVFASVFILLLCMAGTAQADPRGCARGIVDANAPVIGTWVARLKDDESENWESAGTNEFRPDGSFYQRGIRGGSWCMVGDIFLYAFDDAPHTVYRGTVDGDVITGTQSWDGAGTGIFEARRVN